MNFKIQNSILYSAFSILLLCHNTFIQLKFQSYISILYRYVYIFGLALSTNTVVRNFMVHILPQVIKLEKIQLFQQMFSGKLCSLEYQVFWLQEWVYCYNCTRCSANLKYQARMLQRFFINKERNCYELTHIFVLYFHI